jgi:hypothetical protein
MRNLKHIIIYGSFVFCFRLRRAEGTAALPQSTRQGEGGAAEVPQPTEPEGRGRRERKPSACGAAGESPCSSVVFCARSSSESVRVRPWPENVGNPHVLGRICNPTSSNIRICNPRKHRTCLSFRILNAYTQCIGIANPDEQNASQGIKTEPVRESPWQ